MRRILAVDTSTRWGSVALVACDGERPPELVAEYVRKAGSSHARHLIDWIDRLLAEAGWVRSAVDLFVATRGPGSFTGIRIALGTVRGLALATGRPAVGVSTLEALAAAHGVSERARVPVMDAGRGELYVARYDAVSMPPVERGGPWLVATGDLSDRIPLGGAVLIPGPGTCLDPPASRGGLRVASSPLGLAGAAGVVAALRQPTDDETTLSPLYIRPPDAVLKRRRA